jgi:hypothetical protein
MSDDASVKKWALVFNKPAWYMQTAPKEYDKVEKLNWRALKEREKQPGKQYPSTLTSVSNLASVLASYHKTIDA